MQGFRLRGRRFAAAPGLQPHLDQGNCPKQRLFANIVVLNVRFQSVVGVLTVSQAREHLSELIDSTQRSGEPVVLTRHGRPVAWCWIMPCLSVWWQPPRNPAIARPWPRPGRTTTRCRGSTLHRYESYRSKFVASKAEIGCRGVEPPLTSGRRRPWQPAMIAKVVDWPWRQPVGGRGGSAPQGNGDSSMNCRSSRDITASLCCGVCAGTGCGASRRRWQAAVRHKAMKSSRR
ncbi:MAG: Antitoxin Phd YefM, type toxin-antitoxin system [Cyanobacteriota bacterium]